MDDGLRNRVRVMKPLLMRRNVVKRGWPVGPAVQPCLRTSRKGGRLMNNAAASPGFDLHHHSHQHQRHPMTVSSALVVSFPYAELVFVDTPGGQAAPLSADPAPGAAC